jgi:hypothetical protein
MLDSARTTDFLLSITTQTSPEIHPVTSCKNTRFVKREREAFHGGKTPEEGS